MRPGRRTWRSDHDAGLAYIATTDRRAVAGRRDGEAPLGRLFRLDLREDLPQPVEVTPPELRERTFHPQGIDLYGGPEGRRLIVVNRMPQRDPASGAWDSCEQVAQVLAEAGAHAVVVGGVERVGRNRRHAVEPHHGPRLDGDGADPGAAGGRAGRPRGGGGGGPGL